MKNEKERNKLVEEFRNMEKKNELDKKDITLFNKIKSLGEDFKYSWENINTYRNLKQLKNKYDLYISLVII